MNNPDIADRDDIRALLVAFYTRAYADDLLGTIFTDIARMDLDAHLPTMCDFWETVLFRSGTYRGNAYIPHAELHEKVELTWPLFERWLELWRKTVDERHAGPKSDRAKLQAERIAVSIHHRLASGSQLPGLRPIPAPR